MKKGTSPKYVDEIQQGCRYRSDVPNNCDDDDSEDSEDNGDDQDEYEGQAVNGAIRAVGALKFPLRVWTRPLFSTHIRHFLCRQNYHLQDDGDDYDDHNRKRKTKENQQQNNHGPINCTAP